MKKPLKTALSSRRNLFTPEVTAFDDVNWLLVFQHPDFKMLGLCNDLDKPACYGTPVILDKQKAPFQGLPYVAAFNSDKELELNRYLLEHWAIQKMPHRFESFISDAERRFFASWVPSDIQSSAEYVMFQSCSLAQKRSLFLEECIQACRQAIYYARLVQQETIGRSIDQRQRQERSQAQWAQVDAKREEHRQLRAKLKRENRELVFTKPAEQGDLFGSAQAA